MDTVTLNFEVNGARGFNFQMIGSYCRLFMLSFLLQTGCRGKVPADQVPVVPVDFVLNIMLPNYSLLQWVGNYAYLEAGYRGIVLYRSGLEKFQAYDRACTYAPSQSCHKVSVVDSLMTLQCACCDSRFSLLDGAAVRGPAGWPLRTYRVYFDEISGAVRITN
jgi:nitrite reductase/ring-hydroxylating ferredoxin subunit